jgi:ribosomal protein S12 methylthiotransferase accessory factor
LPIPVVPFRADRSYRHAFRPDFGDMQQLAYNLQYYLDPSTLPGALARLRRQEAQSFDVAAAAVATGGADPITALLDCGMPVYSVDVTTPDMGARGFTVVRALCPSLVGNTATAFVPRTHLRLLDACRTTGAPLCLAPLPHA